MQPVNILAIALLGGAEALVVRPVFVPAPKVTTSSAAVATTTSNTPAVRPVFVAPAKASTTSKAVSTTSKTSTSIASSTSKFSTITETSSTSASSSTKATSTTSTTTTTSTSTTSTTSSIPAKPTTTSAIVKTTTTSSIPAAPTTTSTTPATTSTTKTSTTTAAAPACTSTYYQYGCLPLTNDAVFVNTMLKQHNTYRARHNAPAMTWSSTLAAAALVNAQNNADKNIFVHTSYNLYGENIAYQYGWDNPEYLGFLWYDEERKFDFTNGGFADATGHFTQMVWQSSTQLGCAYVQAKNSLPNNGYYYLSCEYSTPGNYDGEYRSQVLAPNSQPYPSAPPQWL